MAVADRSGLPLAVHTAGASPHEILFVEETFGFSVDNDEAVPDNFDTVDNIVQYVVRKL